MPRYILGLGSSVPLAHSYIQRAILMLDREAHIKIVVCSPFFLSPSAYGVTQFRFVNNAIAIMSQHSPLALLQNLRKIEHRLGRIRLEKNNSRTIDIDILYSPDVEFNHSSLFIPHPRLQDRDFARIPALQALKLSGWTYSRSTLC